MRLFRAEIALQCTHKRFSTNPAQNVRLGEFWHHTLIDFASVNRLMVAMRGSGGAWAAIFWPR
jgi:ureidoglycolate hydrolase